MSRIRSHAGVAARFALAVSVVLCAGAARAAWSPPGVDLTRPRIAFRAGDEPVLQARLEREPYVSIVDDMMRRTRIADDRPLDDHSIEAERFKSRAAKNLAFLYALDRTLVGDAVLPFPTPADRAAVGQRVHDLLVSMYTRSRLAVPPPLGGWDRDISTSEELLQYATAYDLMLGAGWDFGADAELVERNIVDLASELYENFVDPPSAQNFTALHQNNHRSKSGAAMVVAAIAVAEHTPDPGDDPRNVREPTLWLEYGLDQVDLIMRHVLVTGDGAYAEGPFYLRFASQNLIPFARAWDRLVGGASWQARGIEVPSLWRHPLWLATQRWMLDLTLPDGSMAPIDDGNPGRSHYFGILPHVPDLSSAYAWRWANAPQPLDTDGNVDLAADAIALFDDGVPPAPPAGPTTAFYVEGGNAVFRSDWSTDGVVAIVQAEHDTASQFGRNRSGVGVSPQSHEHAEPGSFLMHAFGERLAIDPGYLSFPERTLVNQPQHHNVILVDGKGPVDYLGASLTWLGNLLGPPPADGQAYLSDVLDGTFVDAATVTTSYGLPPQRTAEIERRVLFADDRYLAIADEVASPGGPPRAYTWLLHGNGGGTSGGSFEATPAGARWTRPLARLDLGLALDAAAPAFATSTGTHEAPGRIQTTHTVLAATATGERLRSLQLVYPTRSGDAPPAIEQISVPGAAALRLLDAASDRRVLALHRASGAGPVVVPGAASGIADAESDGARVLFDAHADGRLRFAWADDATLVRYAGVEHLRTAARGRLGIALGDGVAHVVVDDGAPEAEVRGVPFVPLAADGACALDSEAGVVRLGLSRERRVTLRADAGNSAPAADPGPTRFAPLGARLLLDASASCDLDGDPLAAAWRLVSAPQGASWAFDDADTPQPSFVPDVPGLYRFHLTVTDAHGAASRPVELVVRGFGADEDADGDLVPDDADNCPALANADQADAHPAGGNGVGDACECTDGTCVAGGGPAATDCALALRVAGDAAADGRRVVCRDGAACDLDPTRGTCGFDVLLCLATQDASEPACTPFAPRELRVQHWLGDVDAILAAVGALPGAARSGARTVAFDPPLAGATCTDDVRLTVPVPGRTLTLRARGAERRAVDADRVRFVCGR